MPIHTFREDNRERQHSVIASLGLTIPRSSGGCKRMDMRLLSFAWAAVYAEAKMPPYPSIRSKESERTWLCSSGALCLSV